MSRKDPHSYSNLSQGKIKHINFEIKVDFTSRTLDVLAMYYLDQPATGSLFLDTRDIQIDRVSQGGKKVKWSLDKEDPILGERLHLHDLQRVSEFSIKLKTSPDASALQWLTPRQTTGGLHPFVYSQCYALHARSIFPCQDSPSVRITYDATIKFPDPLVAVMAAEKVGQKKQQNLTTFSFRMPQPIPSYLFAFSVGNLRFKALGPRTGIFAEPEVLDAAAWEFGENESKLEQAEMFLGPYLWDRYDVLIMPPSFPFGGMENPRLTFLSPTFIIGDRSATNVITHELAHAWTGNLVTNATWEDFWINEGWTTYAESRITEILEGSEVDQLIRYLYRIEMHEDIQRFGMDSDFTCLKYSQKGVDPEATLSYIPYIKGASFLVCIEQAVGRGSFDEFIKSYISKYRFSSITTEEFLAYLLKALPETGERVDINEWVYRPGYPEDAPVLHSELYDEVKKVLSAYSRGVLPVEETIQNWQGRQIFQFLRLQEKKIPVEDCKYFEELFGLNDMNAAGLLCAFYLLAIPSEYFEIREGLDSFVKTFGRFDLITQLFRRMVEIDWTREFARSLFKKYRDRHHPITVARIETILTEAEL